MPLSVVLLSENLRKNESTGNSSRFCNRKLFALKLPVDKMNTVAEWLNRLAKGEQIISLKSKASAHKWRSGFVTLIFYNQTKHFALFFIVKVFNNRV